MGPKGEALPCGRLPAFVWLAPESLAHGYSASYLVNGKLPTAMVRAGLAMFCFDPIGTGMRLTEATRFYERYPRWSLLGKMVHDARRAIDSLLQIPAIDPARIFLVGFGSGGTAALFAAALDQRVAGVASVCGFTPMRSDTAERPTGGLARYAIREGGGLLPRLGFFVGEERRIPIDYDEILAAVAPRPLICITPTRDREANSSDVGATLDSVAGIYDQLGASRQFIRHTPVDHRRFGPEIQQTLYAELRRIAGM